MNRKISEDKDSNFSNSFIFRYLPYLPLFLLLTLMAFGGAWFYLKFTTPQYEVNARILIKDEKKGSEDAKALESPDLISSKKTIDNEMEVIQSKTLLTNVVKNLNLYAPVCEEQHFKSISAYSSSPVTIVADSNNRREVAKVYFTADKNSIKIGNKSYPLNEWTDTPYGRLKFKKNIYRTSEETDKKLFFSLIAPKKVVSSLASRLKVTAANKMSNIVDLNFTDENPARGEDIVNELIKVYNKSIIDEKNVLASNTLEFINEQLARVEDDMVANEHKLQSYNAHKGTVDTQGKLFLEKVGGNDQKVSDINQKLSVLNQINREQNLKSHLYEFLQQKKEETQLSYVSDLFGSKVVDHAKASEYPVSPKKKFAYLSAVLLALTTGFGIVVGKETLGSKVMSQKEIENLTKLPVIGEITAEKSKSLIVIGNNQKTLIAEQFRKLRTTLNYLGIGNKQKRILITSAISGEGKSFVAANLAISLALTDKKVVLVDFDLNNPSLATKLNIHTNQAGVAEYLQGKTSPDTIIAQTAIDENLSFISAGKLLKNPSELIMNGKAEDLLNYLDGIFDYIIIDIAPVSPVSDAYIISPFCDATLYIVRHGYTPKVPIERIDENNRLKKLTNAAIVFNGVPTKGLGNSYGYGYGYGYSYTYVDKKTKLLPALKK